MQLSIPTICNYPSQQHVSNYPALQQVTIRPNNMLVTIRPNNTLVTIRLNNMLVTIRPCIQYCKTSVHYATLHYNSLGALYNYRYLTLMVSVAQLQGGDQS